MAEATEIAFTAAQFKEAIRNYATAKGLAPGEIDIFMHPGANGEMLSALVRVRPVQPDAGSGGGQPPTAPTPPRKSRNR